MATINISINATIEDFSTFADELGYQALVSKTQAEIALLPKPVEIQDTVKANPQSKTDFLLEYFKNTTTVELARVKMANIQRAVDTAKEAEKIAMRTAIESAVTVTVV